MPYSGAVVPLGQVKEFDEALDQLAADEEYPDENELIVVNFYTTWAGPARQFGYKFRDIAAVYRNALFAKVDMDEVEDLVERYNLNAIPTTLFIKNKEVIAKIEGNVLDKVEEKLKELDAYTGPPDEDD